jgi:hypothetical protein
VNTNLAIGLAVGPVVLIVILLAAIRRWVASKQHEMSAEEFRRWYAKNCLGMRTDSLAPARRADSPTKPGKAPPAAQENGLRGSSGKA